MWLAMLEPLPSSRWFRNRNATFSRNGAGETGQSMGNAARVREHKPAESKKGSNEEFHRLAFDLSPMGMAITDDQTRFTKVNQRFCDIVGYTADELLEMKIGDFTYPDDLAANKVRNDELHSGALDYYDIETRYVRKDSSIRWVRATVRIDHSPSGELQHSIYVVQDITESRQIERALRESEAFSRSVLESSPDCVMVLDLKGRIQYINRNGLRLLQINDPRPLIGKKWTDLYPDAYGAMAVGALESAKRGETARIQALTSTAGGTLKWWDVVVTPISAAQDDGATARLIAVSRDITESTLAQQAVRDQEERFRSLFDSMQEGYCLVKLIFDASGRPCDYCFLEVNPAFVGHTGLKGAKGRLASELRPGFEPLWIASVGKVALSGKAQSFQSEDKAVGRFFEVTAHRIGGPESRKVGIVFSDITERKRVEAELAKTDEELRLADSRKDAFLATLAHELRNPLAAVKNSLELSKRASGNASLMERVHDTMERQLGQMVHLIDDLMDVSRITRDRLELRLERVELASLVHYVVEAARPHCERAGHQLQVTLPPELTILNADPVRLAQVLGNLLNNACKYTPPGGRIWLTVECHGNEVALTVKDSGVGIAPEMLHEVFELFTQIRSSLEQSQGGLGIGLSLAKRLTALHGGTVTAHSEGQDKGSEFVVRLPVCQETAVVPVTMAVEPSPVAARRILVVDDMRDSADSLAMLLSMGGDETQTAYDGVEAVGRAASFQPNVILLDIGMPKMNGHDACQAIRRQPGGTNIVIIAMTGWGQENDRRMSRDAGFDHHLVKPVDFHDLLQLLAYTSSVSESNIQNLN